MSEPTDRVPARPRADASDAAPTPAPAVTPLPVDRDELERLVGGAHHDPHAVLGAHPARPAAASPSARCGRGRRGVAVVRRRRALPSWSTSTAASGRAWSPATQVPDYRLEVTYDGAAAPHRRPLPLPADARRDRPAPDRRGPARAAVGGARRARPRVRRPRRPGQRHVVRGVGAERARRAGRRRLQLLGRPRAPDARAGLAAACGSCSSPTSATARTTSSRSSARDGVWRQKADPMAFAHRGAAGDRVGRVRVDVRVGRRRVAGASAPRPTRTTAPMSIYEVHLGSWRQGLSYRELADQLVGYVTDLGFTHVEFLPVAEHPFGGSWGYQVIVVLRADRRASATPTTSATSSTGCTRPASASSSTGCRRTSPRTSGRWPASTAPPLYEHADPRRGEQPDWGTLRLRLRPQRGAQLPGRQRARTGSRSSTSTGCGSTPSPRCSTSTTRARRASGCPTSTAGARTSRRSRSCRRSTPRRTGGSPASSRSPRSRRRGRASPGRPTSAGSASASSGTWAGCTTRWATSASEPIYRQYHHHQMTFSMMYAYSENFVLPISHDEVVHGKGSLLRKMPGDRWQQLANLRAYLAFMWAHPGKQLLFMGSEFGQESEWAEARVAGLVAARQPRPPRRADRWSRDLNRVYAESPALWTPRRRPGRLPVDRRQRREQQRVLVPAPRRRRLGRWPASRTSPACRTRATGSACRRPGAGARCSTPTPTPTAAAASATSARVEATASAVARPAGLGHAAGAAARHRLAAPPGLTSRPRAAGLRCGGAPTCRRASRRAA